MPLGEGGRSQQDGAFGWVLYHDVLPRRTLGRRAWLGFDLLLLQLVLSPLSCCPLLLGRCHGRQCSPPPALRTNSALQGQAGCCDPLRHVPESLFQTQCCAVWLGTGCNNGNGLMSLNHPLSKQFMGHHVALQHQGCSAASAITSLLELDHGSLETLL